MATPASLSNPATGTAAPLESEPALLMKFNPFSQIVELFGEGNALEWIDSLQGVQAVSVGEAHPAWDSFQGRLHTELCSETLQCPFRPNPSPATQDCPKLITACLEMEISWFQARSTNQGWFYSNPRAAGFTIWHEILVSPELLPSLPRLFWEDAVMKCSQQGWYWALGSACGAGDLKSWRSHITWGHGPQIWTCFPFTNLLTTVL